MSEEEVIFPKYGSIENLYRSGEVLEHEVVVTEKIHGTNCRVMWTPNGLYIGGRNHTCKDPNMEFPNKYDGFGFTLYFENHPSLEVFSETSEFDGYVFHGEFCGANIQKGIKYSDHKETRKLHVIHHNDVTVNFGIVFYWFDKLYETFTRKGNK